MKHIIVKIDTITDHYDDAGIWANEVIEREISDLMGIDPCDIDIEILEE
jgi:hypothetical protein